MLIAQAQSAGRGRGGHSFSPRPAGCTRAFFCGPRSARGRQGPDRMAAVAAARAAERLCGVPITIKWVNDLWKNGKKVCGILTEAALDLESGMLDYAVLGLGFNLAAGGRLAGGPAGRGGGAVRPLLARVRGRAGGGVPERLLAALPRRAAQRLSGRIPPPPGPTGQRVLVTPCRGTPCAAQV